ncbi:hypothetical protein SM18210_20120 [Xanthomonas hortorum pv. gardneri]|nr:hypothetical protein SM18210_20120 [Xanthomonas hortorum pv. gardneri]
MVRQARTESGKQQLGIATSTSRPVPDCSHMNIAIISEQITLQCSITAGVGSARRSCPNAQVGGRQGFV